MDIIYETLHVMDQCFFNLYQKGPSIFGYIYLLYVTYRNKENGNILCTTYVRKYRGVSI